MNKNEKEKYEYERRVLRIMKYMEDENEDVMEKVNAEDLETVGTLGTVLLECNLVELLRIMGIDRGNYYKTIKGQNGISVEKFISGLDNFLIYIAEEEIEEFTRYNLETVIYMFKNKYKNKVKKVKKESLLNDLNVLIDYEFKYIYIVKDKETEIIRLIGTSKENVLTKYNLLYELIFNSEKEINTEEIIDKFMKENV